jgi:Glycoside-hydrolase family GH114
MRFGFPRSILNPRASLLAVLLASSSCTGTEGTLVVRHDAAAGAPSVAEKPYIPPANARWLAELDGAVDVTEPVDFFYLDADQQPQADLDALHADGRHYICYLSAGTVEAFRDDAKDFPESAVGNVLAGFSNERWLDVRDATVRKLMARRVEVLAAHGCDAVPPSSLAVHVADTGFDLTLADALDYASWLAARIQAAGMSAGLSGPSDMTGELWPSFDFGLAIGCVASTRCGEYAVFGQAKKSVLHIELGDANSAPAQCKSAQTLGFEALISDPGFTGKCTLCRDIL